ncbi:hypothetical protein [Neobacillus massiliamazoniensis]|uniref:DUF4304 domain-containing protein n=1 Tax=Neobacillus massiliamazoniensis TaxID=1499688 RepID=A0A0U1P2Q3_9BACI|nr:hypothetical protein [Neobacillus massiliamazoniensis]CRK84530.1 hypothetical protein BN000_04562 [Neobacillus massiliamazoniensis]
MKPKELLNHYIENQLVAELQKLGFRYAKSVPKFSRTKGDFELTFSFSRSQWNAEDYCQFWTIWDVSSKKYSKWFKEQWGNKPVNNVIVCASEYNVPGWTREVYKQHFTLTNSESDIAEFNEFVHNVLNVGIPYYTHISDWNIAAEYASQEIIVFYDKVSDFYLISGQKEKAKEILELGIKEIERRKHDQYMLLPEIQKRLDKYFN